MSLADVAKEVETTYEHIRKLLKGFAYPSKGLLDNLCRLLSINKTEAQTAVTSDRMQHKLGDTAFRVLGMNPELEPINRDWPYLQDVQKQMIYQTVRTFARDNRAAGMKKATN